MYGQAGALAIGAPLVGGTPGSVLFVGAAGEVAQDNTNLFWDDAADVLHIGPSNHANAQFRLNSVGSVAAGVSAASLRIDPGANSTSFNRCVAFNNESGSVQWGTINVASDRFHISAGNNFQTGFRTNAQNINLEVGTSGAINAVVIAGTTGTVSFVSKIFPGTDASASQSVSGIFAGNGAPNNANGANGDFYFRGDGTQAGNTVIYHKEAGAWVALITT